MNNFNLLVSSPRFNEVNAKAELWFSLLICGDKYPIISDLEFQGLITALTNVDEFKVIQKIKQILTKDPYFYRYILKIIPIQFICKSEISLIQEIVELNYKKYINTNETFRIKMNRRKNEYINRDPLINAVAKNINSKVDLENPDVIIRLELLDNLCGISFLKEGDIIKPKNKFIEEKN
ncbi:MAG: hypothetical protein GF317_06345 [Candidatus Lokiarchaeota archaeon]|nr:hypothetical protein [Candidatus Lokiarchaeota archaeon]MBD3199342.1 hypothetical protein [Candidatus Lokiarchaeota archaeon]